jgi:hypothetical protein
VCADVCRDAVGVCVSQSARDDAVVSELVVGRWDSCVPDDVLRLCAAKTICEGMISAMDGSKGGSAKQICANRIQQMSFTAYQQAGRQVSYGVEN